MKFFAELERLHKAARAESPDIKSLVREIVTTYHPTDNEEDKSAEHMEALKKAAEKITRKILKQKVRGLIGRDAKFMDKFSRLFPALSVKWYEIKVKHSKAKLFENVK